MQRERAPTFPPPRPAACRDTHGWGEGSGAKDEEEEKPQQHEQTEAWTEDGNERRSEGGEEEEERGGERRSEGGRRRTVGQRWRRRDNRRQWKRRRKKKEERGGRGAEGGTCARPIVGGLHPGGLGTEGALLQRRGAVQAALAHSVQVAAICPNTRGRYGWGGLGCGGRGGVSRTGVSAGAPGGRVHSHAGGVKPEQSVSPGKPPPPRQTPRCFFLT